MTKNILIIWWWFGGLASAILMAKDGHKVTLIEKNDHVGGRASLLKKDGFERDMWPSRYLMPDVFQKFFESIGENVQDHLTLTKLSPQYRIYFEEDTEQKEPHYIEITGDIAKDMKTLEAIEPGVSDAFMDYLKKSELQYDVGMQYVYKNYDSIFDFFTFEILQQWLKLKIFSTFSTYVKKFFATSKMHKIVQYPLVFLGTAPYDAPALYNIMSHVDFNLWLFYPQGGIYEIVRVLKKIGKKHGVTYLTNTEAQQLNIDPQTKKITTVQTSQGSFTPDLVICNADMAWAETTLLAPEYQTYPATYWHKKTFAPSAFLVYLWVNKKLPILHHTLIFSEDRKKNFGAIFDTKELPENPSLYICTPSKTDPTVAPEGRENLFVLVPIPNGITVDKETEDRYEKMIFDYIERTCHISFQENIVSKHRFHVADFQSRYNARNGTALGLAHKLSQTALRRPNNISKKVKNLFYVGHNTNPGIGMPMVMVSAMLAHQRVTNYLKKHW